MKPPSSSQEVRSPPPPLPGSVLVTGASSGIGLAIVSKLATEGITVYAGIRSETDYKHLQSLPHVVPLYLDITNAEHIAYLPTFLDQHGQKLYALINNAGIADLGASLSKKIARTDYFNRFYEWNLDRQNFGTL